MQYREEKTHAYDYCVSTLPTHQIWAHSAFGDSHKNLFKKLGRRESGFNQQMDCSWEDAGERDGLSWHLLLTVLFRVLIVG
jgi:hypothetical protein